MIKVPLSTAMTVNPSGRDFAGTAPAINCQRRTVSTMIVCPIWWNRSRQKTGDRVGRAVGG
ncbi:hypothetical protein EN792_019515 [Mesorhizobium sp. M00.F.Ca.ET.149.01.1.1]|nr:hypothetical protein EN792_019515 [Mesorhizobium sp. M00.F.Ca.ET.149.01.1.1]